MNVAQKIKGRPDASGFAVIISNDYSSTPGLETLTGTRKDAQNMDAALQSLNIVTHCEHNVTTIRLMELLYKAAQCKDYPQGSKCIIFVFAGHGLDSNQVYMQDGSLMKINGIIEQFLPEKAPMIGNIPKLFFIDACRGDRTVQCVTVPRGGYSVREPLQKGANEVPTMKIPAQGNFLVAYSTMPYYRSYESKGNGGMWMSALARKLPYSKDSIEDILTEVNEELIELYQSPHWRDTDMQQPEKISRLNKRVYLGQGARDVNAMSPGVSPGATGAGQCRAQLNQMFQDREISKPEYNDTQHYDATGGTRGFTSSVTFVVTASGKTIASTSPNVETQKLLARESAAKLATSMILATRGGDPITKITPTAPAAPKPKRAATSPGIGSSPTGKTAVSRLKEYCEKNRLSAQYREVRVAGEQRFQYEVTVPTHPPVTVRGDVCGTKAEAKHNAAQKAMQRLGIN